MNSTELILNSRTGLLRSGWRAAIFIVTLNSPYLISELFLKREETGTGAAVEVSLKMILTYVVLVAWVVAVSWICLKFLERMKLAALGFALHSGWFSDVLKGCVTGALMIASAVMLQIIGGARLKFNPIWLGDHGIEWTGVRIVATEIVAALVLL